MDDVAGEFGRALPQLTHDVLRAIAAEVPLYARPFEGEFGRNVQRGVTVALSRFVEVASHPDRAAGDVEALAQSRALGQLEAQARRPLDTLLAAYRVGARVAWRSWAELMTARGDVDPAQLVDLAERLFAYIDALSAAAAEGYATEHGALAGERERLREGLVRLLLRPVVDPDELRHHAAEVGWPVPASLAVVLAPADAPLRMRLGPDALVLLESDERIALVPAPLRLDPLRGVGAVVGPTLPVARAAVSLARARRARELGLPGDPLVTDEHHLELPVHTNPVLLAEMTTSSLAPLQEESASSRERLEETLLAWLQLEGARARVADVLSVHPQTVCYRLSRLRELFGPALDDADTRFTLELVLRAKQNRRPGKT